MSRPLASKPCQSCGRTMQWRRRWARTWDEVRFCSDACRRRGRRPVDVALEEATLVLLAGRPSGGSVCPSEVAKEVGRDDWRALMEPARAAARRLVARGEVVITQGGHVVDGSTARGPIRVRRAR